MIFHKLRFLICLLLLAACSTRQQADVIISGGTIYTVDEQHPTAEAVVIKNERIVFVGSKAEAMTWKGATTKLIDLEGRTMTPGLIEGHGHFFGLGFQQLQVDLSDARNYDEVVEKVKTAVAKAKPGDWIIGRGWHQDRWTSKPAKLVKGFQTHELLSAVSPENPVALSHASGHAIFVNANAMTVAGINKQSAKAMQQQLGKSGEIILDTQGNPTGILVENAEGLVMQHIPSVSQEQLTKAFDLASAACLKNGITSFCDAGIGRSELDLLKKFRQEGRLQVRLYEMLSGSDRSLINDYFKNGKIIDSAGWLTVRSLKLYSDGALGSRGAWLLAPYADRKETSGLPLMSMDTLERIAGKALKAGFQVCTHAIGDRANREVLDRYEAVLRANPALATDSRFRIEHAQHIDPQDIPRFAKLGVIPAMQPIHLSSDRPWAIDRLGIERIRAGAYLWQTLIKSGAHVVSGTDVPVEPINPIACFFASVTRQTLEKQPPGGYEPAEKMTRAQALKAYTLDAAYGEFDEKLKGSITVGKLADFTVFSQDLMTVPVENILSTEVVMTIVGGKVRYEKK